MPIKAADNNNNEKPINSIPMFNATNREYKIAVVTPVHSKILLFIIKCYQKALECTIWFISFVSSLRSVFSESLWGLFFMNFKLSA